MSTRPGFVAGFLLGVGAPDGPNGFAESDVSGYYLWHTPRTPALVSRELGDSRRALACPGVVMCLAGPSRSSEVAGRAGVTPCHEPTLSVPSGMAGTGGGVSQTPVGYGLAGSSDRQPEPGAGARGRSTAAGPGGGTTLGEGHRWRHRLHSPSETGAHRCHRFLRTPRPHSQVWALCSAFHAAQSARAGIGVLLPRTPWLCHGLHLWMT